ERPYRTVGFSHGSIMASPPLYLPDSEVDPGNHRKVPSRIEGKALQPAGRVDVFLIQQVVGSEGEGVQDAARMKDEASAEVNQVVRGGDDPRGIFRGGGHGHPVLGEGMPVLGAEVELAVVVTPAGPDPCSRQ